MITFPLRKRVTVMHPGLVARHNSVQVSQIFYNETQKFWSALYMWIHIWALVSICSTQVKATRTIYSFSVRIRWITMREMCRRASRALVDKCQSSVTAQTVLMFVSVIAFLVDHLFFFSHSNASFRFFENAECHFGIVSSAIHSDP